MPKEVSVRELEIPQLKGVSRQKKAIDYLNNKNLGVYKKDDLKKEGFFKRHSPLLTFVSFLIVAITAVALIYQSSTLTQQLKLTEDELTLFKQEIEKTPFISPKLVFKLERSSLIITPDSIARLIIDDNNNITDIRKESIPIYIRNKGLMPSGKVINLRFDSWFFGQALSGGRTASIAGLPLAV